MPVILIANLGNRNITYKGKTFSDVQKDDVNNFSNFLSWTEELEKNYSSIKEDLDLNIINPLITMVPKPDKIILFYSDQSNLNTRTDQDTVIEARLIKNILEHKYAYEADQISLEAIRVKVIETGPLMNAYRHKLNAIKKGVFSKVIICDAGGTAQQKMALKVMAEFMFEADQYEIKYTEDNSIISDVSVMEYRSVINKEQAIKLLQTGEFLSAIEILGFNLRDLPNDPAGRILIHLFWRFSGNIKKAQNAINHKSIATSDPVFQNYINQKSSGRNIELSEVFGDQLLSLTDRLAKVNFLLKIQKYSEAVLAFSQFYEMFLEMVISDLPEEYDFGKPNGKKNTTEQYENLIQFFRENYPFLETHTPRIDQLNTQLLIIKAIFKQHAVGRIAMLLSPHITFTDNSIDDQSINAIRNKIAHEGFLIEFKAWKTTFAFIDNCIYNITSIFDLPEPNEYSYIIDIAEEKLRS